MRKNHDGSPLDPQAHFFAPPPPEIGAELSRSTTIWPGNRGRVRMLQIVQGIACGLLGAIFFGLCGGAAGMSGLVGGALAGAALGGWLGAAFLVPQFCSYVGSDGVALYARYGTIVRKQLVPFVAAGDLRIEITKVLLAGRHVGDVWDYRFIGKGGATLLKLRAPTAGADKHPGAHVHFLRAAQAAWQAHQVKRAAA